MSRDYPPLTRKKQKTKDGREWMVSKYSYIYAIVFFSVAALGLLLGEESGLFIAPILAVVGVPFLVAAINCRVTMNAEQITVRNFFRISKTYSFSDIESWRRNTHYVYLYPVSGRRICIKREDDVEDGIKQLILRLKQNGAHEREGVSDSKLYWGNCSRPITWTLIALFAGIIAMFFTLIMFDEVDNLLMQKEDLERHTFVVVDVHAEEEYVTLYGEDTQYDIEYGVLNGQSLADLDDLVGTQVTAWVDSYDVWELTDAKGVSWYTFEEYQRYRADSIWIALIFFLLFSGGGAVFLTLLLLAYHAPHKHPRLYENFETTNIFGKGRVYTFTGIPSQKGNI